MNDDILNCSESDISEDKHYLFCQVVPEGKSQGFYYISDIEDLHENDTVVIPFGRSNNEVYGTISKMLKTTSEDAPFPPEKTKRILRKIDNTKEYEFLCVLPITHKQKVFSYINTLPDVQIGDYVEIDFRGEPRVSQVRSIVKGTLESVPENFMGSMKVLRKLNYDNCDYIRFQSELAPLAEKHELYVRKENSDFKSDKHRITEKALAAFETVYRVRLPEEYRYIIRNTINEYDELFDPEVQRYIEEYTKLKNPFRYEELIRRAIEEESALLTIGYDCDDNCAECENKKYCSSEIPAYISEDEPDGTLLIGTGYYLIVNGNYAGAIIHFDGYSGDWYFYAKSIDEYICNRREAEIQEKKYKEYIASKCETEFVKKDYYDYCEVKIDGIEKSYAYLAPFEPVKVGDEVIVPFGSNNAERTGLVVAVERFTYENAPYPPEKTKRIICGVYENETLEEMEEQI